MQKNYANTPKIKVTFVKSDGTVYAQQGTIDFVDVTIDETMNKFIAMQDGIENMDENMNKILVSTKEVVDYNNTIREHVEHLSSTTEQVSAYAAEALGINEENKTKTQNTKILIVFSCIFSSKRDCTIFVS